VGQALRESGWKEDHRPARRWSLQGTEAAARVKRREMGAWGDLLGRTEIAVRERQEFGYCCNRIYCWQARLA